MVRSTISVSPDLEKFLREHGAYLSFIKYARAKLKRKGMDYSENKVEYFYFEILGAFPMSMTEEGADFWLDMHNSFSKKK
jgi:hypothetical protein